MNALLSDEQLRDLQGYLDYSFSDPSLLRRAMTHSSVSHRGHRSNERLEFLGDSILEAVICEYLFRNFPDLPEGRLSEIRSVVVSSRSLTSSAQRLKLGEYCTVSRGITKKDKIPDSILANMFESVVAAIYLDGGFEVARRFILENLRSEIEDVLEGEHAPDYKSLLQQYTQKRWNKIPHYRITAEEGPDHRKEFDAVVLVRGEEYGPGSGTSKQEAEQEAARMALRELDVSTDDLQEA